MGRVRTKTTKRAARVLIEKYYPRLNPVDFHSESGGTVWGTDGGMYVVIQSAHPLKCPPPLPPRHAPPANKKVIDEVAIIPSKRLRNKIAGFTTHLMKRIQKGPVRGISFKLQEEERERKDQYVPEVSALDVAATGAPLDVDAETKEMLRGLGFDAIPVNVTAVTAGNADTGRAGRRYVPGAGRR